MMKTASLTFTPQNTKIYVWLFKLTLSLAISLFLVQEAVQAKGLRDDTTCIVIDILPQEKPPPPAVPAPKKQVKGVLKNMFRRKSPESSSNTDREYVEPDVVEELCEEGSAMLSERCAVKGHIS